MWGAHFKVNGQGLKPFLESFMKEREVECLMLYERQYRDWSVKISLDAFNFQSNTVLPLYKHYFVYIFFLAFSFLCFWFCTFSFILLHVIGTLDCLNAGERTFAIFFNYYIGFKKIKIPKRFSFIFFLFCLCCLFGFGKCTLFWWTLPFVT